MDFTLFFIEGNEDAVDITSNGVASFFLGKRYVYLHIVVSIAQCFYLFSPSVFNLALATPPIKNLLIPYIFTTTGVSRICDVYLCHVQWQIKGSRKII